ncbi:MAG: alpha-ketoacid dehydrogenase subunit beta [Nanoarchaeota archaeon]|nr:alpha-ketoacid dehydrogenase subunit beta [Nanoarchaeota archaeon]
MTNLTLIQAVNQALQQEMKRDPTVMVLGEDVGKNGGVFRATEGLWQAFGDERVVDTPLAESGIVGVSLGLAVNGFKPVAEIQFDGFLAPAFDQVISHVGRIRNRSRGRFHAQLVIRVPYGGGIHAPEHHSESPETYFVHTPGIKVVIPSTPYDAKGLLLAAIRDPDPVLFFEPKKIYRAFRQEVPETDYTIPIGKARLVKQGHDITVIAWGAQVRTAEQAVVQAKVDADIIDLRTLSPLDTDTVINSVTKTGRCVIVQEAPKTCGLAAEVIARINERALLSLEAPVARVTGFDTVMPLSRLEDSYLPSPERVVKAIKKTMEF